MSHQDSFPDIPGYEIRAELGRGGMGVVYDAVNIDRQRRVAIKMILGLGEEPEMDLVSLLRFHLEAEAIASLRHRHVLRIHEVGLCQALPYMVLEYADGGTLSDLLKQGRQQPWEAARTIHSVADGIGHAHSRGIIHRDLKPSNVLVFGDGLVKVSDFGLTKLAKPREEIAAGCTISMDPFDFLAASLEHTSQGGPLDTESVQQLLPKESLSKILGGMGGSLDETVLERTAEFVVEAQTQLARREGPAAEAIRLTKTGDVLGTPLYMAPEQICDTSRVGPTADVHAIGCLLFELITGSPLIPGNSLKDVVNGVLSGKRRRLPGNVSRDLDGIFTKCIQPDPADRYQTASELADDLGRFLGGYRPMGAKVGRREERPHPADDGGTVEPTVIGRFTLTWWPFGREKRGDR